MTSSDFLEKLIIDPLVYYVYQRDLSIYGIDSDLKKYTIVVNEDYCLPDELKSLKTEQLSPYKIVLDNTEFSFYDIKEWFNLASNSDIIVWECTFLNKKYVKKEYVKFIISWDPLKLRQNYLAILDPYYLYASNLMDQGKFDEARLCLFELIKIARFSLQVIEHHKIVNYKEVKEDYKKLFESPNTSEDLIQVFLNRYKTSASLLFKNTEGMLQKEKEEKIIKNE